MGLDKLGPHHKIAGIDEDVGDTVLSIEYAKLDTLQEILEELVTMNRFLSLMTDEGDPPTRET